ncbi:MAG TPA: apolipoprotein N-acyltransferase [Polyangiaceae bacterium]|nr:apolipoprotein N-acyltransferase [Polyangiaceae bacterium]
MSGATDAQSQTKPLATSPNEAIALPKIWAALSALLCGVCYFLAFPGIDLWPLGFVALIPLRLALLGQTPKRAFWLGWLSGLTMISLGFYWMVDMMRQFSGFSTPICVGMLLIVNAFQAGRMGLFAWLFVRGERRFPAGIVWLCALVTSELTFPVLFFWSFGAVVHGQPALTQLAEIGGIYAIALVMAAANFGLSEFAVARLQKRAPNVRAALPYLLVPVVAALYGALRIHQVDARVAAAPKAQIGLVQANMSLTGKRSQPNEGMRRHLSATHALTSKQPLDLVIWSETSVMGAMREDDASGIIARSFAARVHVPLLFGAVLVKKVDDARGYAYFNSALITDVKGQVHGRYDKQELVPFSEHMPFGREIPKLYEISPNSGMFERGESDAPLPLGEHRIGTLICNDDAVPALANRVTQDPNTDLLANLTNDAWFGDTTEPWIHLALSKFRAIEHRRFFVRSTNSGVSAFIDPVGRVLAQSQPFKEQTLVHQVAWLRGRTAYELLGTYPYWLAAVFAAYAAFARRRSRAHQIDARR